jgi:UDP-N-acetyl-D-mannosaminuronic acid dehydrogenase
LDEVASRVKSRGELEIMIDVEASQESLVSPPQSVCIVGLGYIGLPTAAALATQGLDVIGVDINDATVKKINAGEAPFTEPDLSVAISGAVSLGRLRANTQPEPADAFILAVPTPFKPDKTADLSHIHSATESIAPFLKRGDLVVLESTSPPGTTVQVSRWLEELRPEFDWPHSAGEQSDVHVAHCPERVLPGRIMIELITNDRVIGGVSPCCARQAEALYGTFARGDLLLTDATTAELVKLSENAYRDVNIAFANELSLISDRLSVDVHEVVALANHHPRVNILSPGPGVGGHCIAVDPWFIVSAAPEEARLIRLAREVNDAKPRHVVDEVAKVARRFREPVIAVLGLAYKANVDDLRESPAVEIVRDLIAEQIGRLLIVEPHVSALAAELAGGATLVTLGEALSQADVVLLLVDHDAFKLVKRSALRGKAILDTRGVWR